MASGCRLRCCTLPGALERPLHMGGWRWREGDPRHVTPSGYVEYLGVARGAGSLRGGVGGVRQRSLAGAIHVREP